MASSFTTSARIEKPAHNDYYNSWEIVAGRIFDTIDDLACGTTVVNTGGGTTVLTVNNGASDEARRAIIKVAGALTLNAIVQVPNVSKLYVVNNATTGAFSTSIQVSGGASIAIPQSTACMIASDGAGGVFLVTPPVSAAGALQTTAIPVATTTSIGALRLASAADVAARTAPDAFMNVAQVMAAVSSNPAFPSGTRLIFQQSTAPIGWTKDTTVADSALRITGGAVTTGGTQDFSTATLTVTGRVGGTALSVAQIPPHTHSIQVSSGSTSYQFNNNATALNTLSAGVSGSAGGGAAHDHDAGSLSVPFDIKYTSAIVCTKD